MNKSFFNDVIKEPDTHNSLEQSQLSILFTANSVLSETKKNKTIYNLNTMYIIFKK